MSIKSLFSPSHYCNFAMMKHLFFLLLGGYLLVSFAACKQHRPYDGQLAHIDSLADVNPDSADVLLISTTNFSLKGGKNEVALLLRIKVDDKLYRPVTHYRDTILRLISYFEHHPKTLPSLLGSTGPALPFLYAGRIFADLGDAPQALDYYQRALDAQPDYREDEPRSTTKQRGLLYSLMGTQLYYQGLYRDALCQYDKAYLYDKLASDTIGVIYDLRDAAEQYKYLNINDSSLLLYGNALQLSLQCNNEHLSRVVQSQIARLYIAKGNFTLAHRYMRPAINHIDTIDISSTYALASVIYKNVGDMDSALYCYDKLLHFGNVTGKSLAFKELASIAIERRELSSALSYLSQYTLYIDSIRKMENAETVARMHAAYNYQKFKEQAAELELSNEKKNSVITFIFSFSIIIVLVSSVSFYSTVKKHKLANKRLAQINAKLKEQSKLGNSSELLEELACLKKEITILTQQLEKTDKEQLLMRKKLEGQISKLSDEKIALEHAFYRASNRQKSHEEAISSFSETSVYVYFAQTAKDKKVVSTEKWNEFVLSAETYYFPDFKNNLMNICRISEQEYRMCLLFKSGFSKADIAKLLLIDRSAVGHAFVRMYTRATHHKGTVADWEKILLVL